MLYVGVLGVAALVVAAFLRERPIALAALGIVMTVAGLVIGAVGVVTGNGAWFYLGAFATVFGFFTLSFVLFIEGSRRMQERRHRG